MIKIYKGRREGEFFEYIFDITGKPSSLSLPWIQNKKKENPDMKNNDMKKG
jgi:hypothetical protein